MLKKQDVGENVNKNRQTRVHTMGKLTAHTNELTKRQMC